MKILTAFGVALIAAGYLGAGLAGALSGEA